MNFIEKFKHNRDKYGLMHPNGIVSGNTGRYTGDYVLALLHRNELSSIEASRVIEAILLCEHPKEKGIMMRWVHPIIGPTQVDDYIGFSTVAKLCFKQELCDRMIKQGWYKDDYYRDGKWRFKLWIGRFIPLRFHIKICSKSYNPNWFEILGWVITVYFSAIRDPYKGKKNEDGKILSWHLVTIGKNYNWLTKKVSNFWWKKLYKQVAGGMETILNRQFAGGFDYTDLGI